MKIDNEMAVSLFPLKTLQEFLQHGDMPIKDLSPRDNNRGGRIIKNMRICGSGIYRYHISEAALMGLVVDQSHGDVEWIDVFRPPEVLERYKDLYARVPIITGKHVVVNTGNAKKLAVGMIGDSIKSEQDKDGETYLYATGTIIAGDGIDAYEELGELSVGYDPIIEWREGEHNGKRYNAVMTGITGVNHVLICKTARGGHQCTFMDSKPELPVLDRILTGGKAMGIFSKIFSTPAKQMNGDARVVSAMLQSIKAGADAKTQVTAVKEMMGDSADATLKGYFDDLMGDEVAKADKETLSKAIDVVDKYCQQALAGDEFPPPKKDEDKKEDDGKKEEAGKKEDDGKKEEAGDKKPEEKPEEEKANGDAVIDYEKIASMVAEKLKPAAQHGDENPITFSPIISHGDSGKGSSSDDILKEIYGGN